MKRVPMKVTEICFPLQDIETHRLKDSEKDGLLLK